jgi:Zn-dependent protease
MARTLQIVVLYYAAVILHESAHALVGEILGVPVKGIRFSWGSIGLVRASGRPLANLVISCSGPALNLYICAALWPSFQAFALINFCLGFCNLLPIRGSDGDRIWTCLAQLGWIEDRTLPAPGLAHTHRWLKSRGLSDWDLAQMELAGEHPAAPGLLSLPKTGFPELRVTPVTRNSCNP